MNETSQPVKKSEALELLRQGVGEFEQSTAEAAEIYYSFIKENKARLESIKAEFGDYYAHPLYEQKEALEDKKDGLKDALFRKIDEATPSLGWETQVIFNYPHPGKNRHFIEDIGDDERIPATLAELNRRIGIAKDVGNVATMLRDNHAQPVVGVARVSSKIMMKAANHDKLYSDYQRGQIFDIEKTRLIVGLIDQADNQPRFEAEHLKPGQERESVTRLIVTEREIGITAAYDVPTSHKFIKNHSLKAYGAKKSGVGHYRSRKIGRSVQGDFTIKQLRGKDLLVIDAPHNVASDCEFSEEILFHRPKQQIRRPSSLVSSQELRVINSPGDRTYNAEFISSSERYSLPAPRHDTIWMIGRDAIENYLGDAITDRTSQEQKWRKSDMSLRYAALDMLEIAEKTRDEEDSLGKSATSRA